jgi:flagellar biosynthesis/type III secretory pathway protein FliH
MTVEPFLHRTLNAESPAEAAVVLERGYKAGLDLARIEAHTQVRSELRDELVKMAAERDAALARASGADLQFEADRLEVTRTLESLQDASAALNAAVTRWQDMEATSIAEIQHQAIQFALEVAEMIVKSVPAEQRLRAALEECVEAQSSSDPVRVRTHPSCLATLNMVPETWDKSKITFVPDSSVAVGDVVCETGPTRIEAGLEATLTRIKRALGVGG